MMRKFKLCSTIAFSGVLGLTQAALADTIFDAAADFSATSNPSGAWAYGWSNSTGSAFNLDLVKTVISGLNIWEGIPPNDSFGNPSVSFNPTASPLTITTATWLPTRVAFHPGRQGQNAIVRWTASYAGTVAITSVFEGRDSVGPTTTDVHVLHNGSSLFSQLVNGFGPLSDKSFSNSLSVLPGDTIDFTVGFGSNGTYFNDTTQLEARIVFSPVPEPAIWALFLVGGIALMRRNQSQT